MSILINASTRAIVQGITGAQARFDTQWCLEYGSRIVGGVSPGKGGATVHGLPVYDTVARACAAHEIDASIIYVSAARVKDAVLEAIASGVRLVVVTAEHVPVHDAAYLAALARLRGVRLVGCNTNGVISPGQSKLGGVGGMRPDELYPIGSIGVCSRSGGMTAEIGLALKAGGYGISTSVAMGGDIVTGMRMADYVRLFENDPDTRAIVLFGEPGTRNEEEVAELVQANLVKKPVVALVAGQFQETYPAGESFGHAAAIIGEGNGSASNKRQRLSDAGVGVAHALEDIPRLLAALGVAP